MIKPLAPVFSIFAVILVLAIAPCCHASDLSTPMSSLKSFGDAMENGDSSGVKEASINLKPDVADAMCEMMKSSKTLHDAAVSKFGASGDDVGMYSKMNITAQLANAKVDENGDTATVTPTKGQPLTLQKQDGQWKVDFANMPGMDKTATMLPMMSKMAAANRDMADDVTAGKFPTAADAQKAYMKRMMAAFMPATTQPK